MTLPPPQAILRFRPPGIKRVSLQFLAKKKNHLLLICPSGVIFLFPVPPAVSLVGVPTSGQSGKFSTPSIGSRGRRGPRKCFNFSDSNKTRESRVGGFPVWSLDLVL